jgi:hypothetical protein
MDYLLIVKILEPLQNLLGVVSDGALVLLEASCCGSVTFYSGSGLGPDPTRLWILIQEGKNEPQNKKVMSAQEA